MQNLMYYIKKVDTSPYFFDFTILELLGRVCPP